MHIYTSRHNHITRQVPNSRAWPRGGLYSSPVETQSRFTCHQSLQLPKHLRGEQRSVLVCDATLPLWNILKILFSAQKLDNKRIVQRAINAICALTFRNQEIHDVFLPYRWWDVACSFIWKKSYFQLVTVKVEGRPSESETLSDMFHVSSKPADFFYPCG